jgi:2,3-bisphosphoglycerate-independent phosphoglycerate mutase
MPDHATPVEARTHTEEPVPFVIYDSRRKMRNEGAAYNESLPGRKEAVVFEEGFRLMDSFIRGE